MTHLINAVLLMYRYFKIFYMKLAFPFLNLKKYDTLTRRCNKWR